jgi:septal ring factor EnvC (AmiA/AmiB activator)
MNECVPCDYESCRAKEEIANIKSKLKENDKEFKHFSGLLNNIANHQTKISADLTIHMAASNRKNDELLRSINALGAHLKEHTDEEMKKQDEVLKTLTELKKIDSEHDKKLSIYGFKIHLLWGGATLLFLLFWEKIKKALGV